MDVSLTIQSLINTIHGLKLSFGVNESVECFDTTTDSFESNHSNHSLIIDEKKCDEFWFRNTPYTFPRLQQLLLEYCMCISAICLIMNLIVYSFVPKLHNNTPGKCLMSLSVSLLLAIITYLISFHIEVSPYSVSCVGSALVRLYSFLSAFCWMNVMAFDVFTTFAKPNSGFRLNKSSQKTFIRYSCYAWLMPALIVIASLMVQANTPFDSPYNPAYGKTICCISHFTAMIIFFICPLSIILTLNVTLFLITAHQLKQTVNETRLVARKSIAAQSRLELNVKLVLVLGLTWIFGFLGMFIKIALISYTSIVLHGLHGAFIFVAFTVKPRVYRLIKSRIRHLRSAAHKRRFSNESTGSTLKPRFRTHADSFDTNSKSSVNFSSYSSDIYRERLSSI